jgi:hypothetical protein
MHRYRIAGEQSATTFNQLLFSLCCACSYGAKLRSVAYTSSRKGRDQACP